MTNQSTLKVIESPLAVIGFNALFNGLANIDQVEASLYRGEPLTGANLLTASYSDLCKRCTNVVVEANNLTAQQIAVVVVDAVNKSAELIEGAALAHFSYEHVAQLSDALQRAQQIINSDDVAVLII